MIIRLSSIAAATTDPDIAQPVCPDCDSEQALHIDLDHDPRPSGDDGWHIVTLHSHPCPRTAADYRKLLADRDGDGTP